MQLALTKFNHLNPRHGEEERENPHCCEGDDNQFKRGEYHENNFVSIKHSVCSSTPYGYTKERKCVGKMKMRLSVKSIKLEVNETHSLTMPIRPKTLRIAQIRYPASQLQMQNYKCQGNIVKEVIIKFKY